MKLYGSSSRCREFISLFVFGPCYEEEPVFVRVFECDEATTPAFVHGRFEIDVARQELPVEGINIRYAEKEVAAAPAPEHCFKLLDKRDARAACMKRRHRRLGL